MIEIEALTTSFGVLQNIAKAMLNLRDFQNLNEKVIELQSSIITAQQQAMTIQQSYTTLETKSRDLEAECMRLKDWSSEKQRYVCREITPGGFAYIEKNVVNEFGGAHKLCCHCFDNGYKSLLQQTDETRSLWALHCPRCKFIIRFMFYKE